MKKFVINILKIILSGALALCVLSIFCLFYYNPCIRITNNTFSTDYVWEKNAFHSQASEGISFGKTDKNGYYNGFDRIRADENIDVLVMGSSQMEGANVMDNQNSVYLLNELFLKNSCGFYAYNIGISGHSFLYCMNNLEFAAKRFSPSEAIIIETDSINFKSSSIKSLLNNTFERETSYNSPIMMKLQKIPYFRLTYKQLKNSLSANQSTGSAYPAPETDYELLDKLLEEKMQKIQDLNVKVYILYHENIKIDYDGNIANERDLENIGKFRQICEKNHITFIDSFPYMSEKYKASKKLPYGFFNTKTGVGHLNKFGHEIMSEIMFEAILGEVDRK